MPHNNEQGAVTPTLKKKTDKVMFKDFTIVSKIGEGSFGKVFKAIKKDDGNVYALKVMNKQFLINNN